MADDQEKTTQLTVDKEKAAKALREMQAELIKRGEEATKKKDSTPLFTREDLVKRKGSDST